MCSGHVQPKETNTQYSCPLRTHRLMLKEETQVLSLGLCCPGAPMGSLWSCCFNVSWGQEDKDPLNPQIGHQQETRVRFHPVLNG